MTDDAVTTRIDVFDAAGEPLDLHFQEYWVQRHAQDLVKGIRFEGVERATASPGVLDAIASADVLLLCPSNPVVSIGPILSVPGVRDAVAERSGPVVGVSPIVGGAPLAGMADKLMPIAGLEVSALGAARAYRGLLSGWVIDERDRDGSTAIRDELGVRVAVTDTVMRDDEVAASVARVGDRAGIVTIEILPVEGLPEIRAGDDLAAMLTEPLAIAGPPRRRRRRGDAEDRLEGRRPRRARIGATGARPGSPARPAASSRAVATWSSPRRTTGSSARTPGWTLPTSRRGSSRCSRSIPTRRPRSCGRRSPRFSGSRASAS